ncbi:MAG: hypothetical protein U5O39_10405 [Gammaproteobacteria bacterium]|nr:hypothetical protein [Gammaproteobacteria bacterium]
MTPFEPGTPALSAEVNANFEALNEELQTIELTPGPEGPEGPQGPKGAQGPEGPAGAGVSSATINAADELELTLTDSSVLNAGPLPGASGPIDQVVATVDCGAGETVQGAIDAAAPLPVAVTISGTCLESVEIRRDGISLIANTTGDGIDASGLDGAAIIAEGADNLLIDGLTLRDDNDRALQALGSSVRLMNGADLSAGQSTDVENITVLADGSTLTLRDTNVQLTPNPSEGRNDAVLVLGGSSLIIEDNVSIEVLSGFRGHAVLVAISSGVNIQGAGQFISNGASIDDASAALLVSVGSGAFVDMTGTINGPLTASGSSHVDIFEANVNGPLQAVSSSSINVLRGSCSGDVCTTTVAPPDSIDFSGFVDGNSHFRATGLRATKAFTVRQGATATFDEAYLDLLNVDGHGSVVQLGAGASIANARCVDNRGVDPATGDDIFIPLPQGSSRIDIAPRSDSVFRNGVEIDGPAVDRDNTCVFDENGPVF